MQRKIKGWTSSYQTFKDAIIMAASFWKPITIIVAIWVLLSMVFSLILRGFIGGAIGDISATAIQVMENGFYIILLLYQFALFIALIHMIEMSPSQPLGDYFKMSYWKKVIPTLILFFFVTAATIIGTILFIIPGVILSIWLTFAIFVFILENKNIIEAIKRSYNLARGWSWAILGRLVFLLLIASIIAFIGVIPVTGFVVASILTVLFSIVTVFYFGITYKQIIALKPSRPVRTDITTGAKVGLVIAAILLFSSLALLSALSEFTSEIYYSNAPSLFDALQN